MKLKGKHALITGASRGIGREIALAFAREGASLSITSRSADELATLTGEIESTNVTSTIIVADLAEQKADEKIVSRAQDKFGAIDILVNNAGVGSSANPAPVVDFSNEFWEKSLYLNLTVPYLLSKAVLPGMIEHGWGRIINIASIAARIGVLHGCAYSASKSGLVGLTRTLALEVAQDGITVNAINPGPTRTAMNDERIKYDAERTGKTLEEIEAACTPIGRRLEPVEIAPLAVYLASDDAAAVTGQSFHIDGGMFMA